MESSLASQLFLGCVKKTPGNLSNTFVDTVEILAEPIRLCIYIIAIVLAENNGVNVLL